MCGVGAKSVAHLMKFHLLQWEVVKVKFLMNSNMTLTVLNLHQKTDPKMQQDFKGQGHIDVAHLHPLTNVPTKSTSYPLQFPRYSPDKILFVKVTTARSKIKSRSHHDVAHLPPNQCPYQVSTSYTLWFPRYSPEKIL